MSDSPRTYRLAMRLGGDEEIKHPQAVKFFELAKAIEEELAEALAHEKHTHIVMEEILGTGNSMEALARKMKDELAEANTKVTEQEAQINRMRCCGNCASERHSEACQNNKCFYECADRSKSLPYDCCNCTKSTKFVGEKQYSNWKPKKENGE